MEKLTLLLLLMTLISCRPGQDATEFNLTESSLAEGIDNVTDIPEIEIGVPLDPSGISDCAKVYDLPIGEGFCTIFQDGFERDEIAGEAVFNWDVLILDYGYDGANVSATIEDKNHLGHIIEKEKAVLFRGRAGGSTHEIYLVSKPFDVSKFDKLYVQFRYLPIGLEEEIRLSWSGERIPESIRVDICNDTDYNCGLEGSNQHVRIRDNSVWDNHFLPTIEFGKELNIRNYVETDWKLGQVLVDLSKYPERKDNMVFKISVAMDEGYFGNNHNSEMEDGVILDDVIVVAVKDPEDGEPYSL